MANNISMKNYLESKEFLSPIQNNLIKTLKNVGPLTRRDLVKQLQTPRTTIYDNLIKLQERKVIEKFTRNDRKRGRPLVFWKVK
jgi:predicted ArsR family transcriptional regulator